MDANGLPTEPQPLPLLDQTIFSDVEFKRELVTIEHYIKRRPKSTQDIALIVQSVASLCLYSAVSYFLDISKILAICWESN